VNVIQKCCLRYIRQNRKHEIITIIGIILATALLSAIAILLETENQNGIRSMKEVSGDFHYCFMGVEAKNLKVFENHKRVERHGVLCELETVTIAGNPTEDVSHIEPDDSAGDGRLTDVSDPEENGIRICVAALDKNCMEQLKVKVLEGRLPETERELLISQRIVTVGGLPYKIGDEIQGKDGAYVITGIMKYPISALENEDLEGFRAISLLEDIPEDARFDVYVRYDEKGLNSHEKVTAGIYGVSEETMLKVLQGREITEDEEKKLSGFSESLFWNSSVINVEMKRFSGGEYKSYLTMDMLYLFLIALLSILCIKNSFEISIREKTAFFGQLASIGATKKQRRHFVWLEAFFLGIIGIPAGFILGAIGAWTFVTIRNEMAATEPSMRVDCKFSALLLLASLVFSILTVFFSCANAARNAAGIMPISAIRSWDENRRVRREKTCPKWIKKMFGEAGLLARQNGKHAKAKYRGITVSIVVSLILIMIATTFVGDLKWYLKAVKDIYGYSILVSFEDDHAYDKLSRVAAEKATMDHVVYQTLRLQVEASMVPYLEPKKNQEESILIPFVALDDHDMKGYCEKLGLSYQKIGKRCLCVNTYVKRIQTNDVTLEQEKTITKLKDGDRLSGTLGTFRHERMEETVPFETEIVVVNERPDCFSPYSDSLTLFIAKSTLNEMTTLEYGNTRAFLWDVGNADDIETEFMELNPQKYSVINIDAQNRPLEELMKIVVLGIYALFSVLCLIGLTNVVNTVNAQMIVRKRELAMLSSLGMTKREIKKMLWLEAIWHGARAMLWGLPLGTVIAWVLHVILCMTFSNMPARNFHFPLLAVLCFVVITILLLGVLFRHGISGLKKANVVEILRRECQ